MKPAVFVALVLTFLVARQGVLAEEPITDRDLFKGLSAEQTKAAKHLLVVLVDRDVISLFIKLDEIERQGWRSETSRVLLKILPYLDTQERLQLASDALIQLGPPTDLPPTFYAEALQKTSATRYVALSWLKQQPLPIEAIPALISMWKDRPQHDDKYIQDRLGAIDRDDKDACDQLIAALTKSCAEGNSYRGRLAATVLGRLGPMAKSAIPEIEKLADKSHWGKRDALIAIAKITNKPEEAVAFLSTELDAVKALEQGRKDRDECQRILHGFQQLGSLAKPAIPTLVELLAHENEVVRLEAATTLAMIGPTAIEAVRKSLRSDNAKVREVSAYSLGVMVVTFTANPPVDALSKACEDKDTDVRRVALHALSKMKSDAMEAVPIVLKALEDFDELARCLAALAVWRIAKRDDLAAELLMGYVKDFDNDKSYRLHFIKALGEMDNKSEETVPTLRALFRDPDPEIRVVTAKALGEIGAPARDAVIELTAAVESAKEYKVKREAARAMAVILRP